MTPRPRRRTADPGPPRRPPGLPGRWTAGRGRPRALRRADRAGAGGRRLVLSLIGRDPIAFYGDVSRPACCGLPAWQDTITRMAPLLLVAAGLIVVFRAGLWNLGIDGQYLLARRSWPASARRCSAIASPTRSARDPLASAGGGRCGLDHRAGLLRACYGVNEIITTLMMSFIGVGLAQCSSRGRSRRSSNVPQTRRIALADLLPTCPGTRIHIGVLVAGVGGGRRLVLMSRDVVRPAARVLGANARAAAHVGHRRVPRLIVVSFLVSGALIGLAAAVEIVGVWGYIRADWNPAFGLIVVPLVFLARLNAIAVIPFVAVPRRAVDRRRLRDAGGRRCRTSSAGARRPDPAVHGRDRVPRAAPRPRAELPATASGAAGGGRRERSPHPGRS